MTINVDSLMDMRDRLKEELGVYCEVSVDGGFNFGIIISVDVPKYGGTLRTKHEFTEKEIDNIQHDVLIDSLTQKIIESMREQDDAIHKKGE